MVPDFEQRSEDSAPEVKLQYPYARLSRHNEEELVQTDSYNISIAVGSGISTITAMERRGP